MNVKVKVDQREYSVVDGIYHGPEEGQAVGVSFV